MNQKRMHMRILLPHQVFANVEGVKRIVIETTNGHYGFMPLRLDCTASLVPGILTYETDQDGEVFVAVDEGILVKVGTDVMISVRDAFRGTGLGTLHKAVEDRFLNIDEQEMYVRQVMAKLEIGFIRRYEKYQKK